MDGGGRLEGRVAIADVNAPGSEQTRTQIADDGSRRAEMQIVPRLEPNFPR